MSLYLPKYHAMDLYPMLKGTPWHEDVCVSERIAPCILKSQN